MLLTWSRAAPTIKTVGTEDAGQPGDSARAKRDLPALPALPRLRHEVVPGLWLFEDEHGQTYLAVKSNPFRPSGEHTYAVERND